LRDKVRFVNNVG